MVAQMIFRKPEEQRLKELLALVFSNIHLVTECSLIDLMEVLDWLLVRMPWLVTVLVTVCQSVERLLLRKLLQHPTQLRLLLKFLSLVL